MSSFWDEFKDLFKTEKQLAEEQQQQIKDALAQEQSVVEQLKQLENQYVEDKKSSQVEPDWESLFPTVVLDEVEYTPKTDEELYQQAKQKTDYEKQSEKDDLFEAYKQSVKSLGEQKTQQKASLDEDYEKLSKIYDELRRDTQYDAIKRGVVNSSHAKNQLANIDGNEQKATQSAQSSYESALEEIDSKLAQLESDKDKALEELDVKYAIELSEQIDALEEERAKAIEQNQEFNNDVREKNAKAQATRDKNIAQYKSELEKQQRERDEAQQAYEQKYGYVGKKQENYAQRYDLAFDFYSSLSPDIAVAALEASPNMKYYLGQYYDKLYSALKDIAPNKTIYY